MNKKMAVIDLFLMLYYDDGMPKHIKIKDNFYEFNSDGRSIEDYYYDITGKVKWLNHANINLVDEVEIIEEDINIQDIEELDSSTWGTTNILEKINEIIKAIKQLDKKEKR